MIILLLPVSSYAIVENQYYTENDVILIAKTLLGECGGVPSKERQAACAWVILNRVDSEGYGDSIKSVITKKSQFIGYKSSNAVRDDLYDLSCDVLERWSREKDGEIDVGRTIPNDYYFFTGNGKENRFRKKFKSTGVYWDWSLPNPYDT